MSQQLSNLEQELERLQKDTDSANDDVSYDKMLAQKQLLENELALLKDFVFQQQYTLNTLYDNHSSQPSAEIVKQQNKLKQITIENATLRMQIDELEKMNQNLDQQYDENELEATHSNNPESPNTEDPDGTSQQSQCHEEQRIASSQQQ